jgi:hypothetical protein
MDVNVALITIGFLYLALAVWAIAKLFIQARRERRRPTIVKQNPGVPTKPASPGSP